MEAECLLKVASQVQSTAKHFRDQLNECRSRVHELNELQEEFRTTVRHLLRKMDKENIFQPGTTTSFTPDKPPCTVTLTSCQTQTCDLPPPPRRWNSDLSLDLDGKSTGKRYHRVERNDFSSYLSTDTVMAPPIIRVSSVQKSKAAPKSGKFTNRLDVIHGSGSKRPADNMLLSDLGLTSQAPDFSQSEFNLSSEEHWLKEGQVKSTGGRVRFLSQDDGQGIGGPEDEDLEGMNDLPQSQVFHSQSASWATLTHSERDLSEMDSSLSLNCQDPTAEGKPGFASSTPYAKALRSKFKQSVSFHGWLRRHAHYFQVVQFVDFNTFLYFRFASFKGNSEHAQPSQTEQQPGK